MPAKVRTIQIGARVWGETYTVFRLISRIRLQSYYSFEPPTVLPRKNAMPTDIPILSLSFDLSIDCTCSPIHNALNSFFLFKSIYIKVINVISTQHLLSALIYNLETRQLKISMLTFGRDQNNFSFFFSNQVCFYVWLCWENLRERVTKNGH